MSTKHLLALLNSHIEGDEDQFLSIVLQVAALEARHGHTEEAEKLKLLVQKARDQRRVGRPAGGQTPIPLARPRGELQGLVESTYPKITLASMILANDVRARLIRVVRQQQERATLREHGQTPTTHMLLVGPSRYRQDNDSFCACWRTAASSVHSAARVIVQPILR